MNKKEAQISKIERLRTIQKELSLLEHDLEVSLGQVRGALTYIKNLKGEAQVQINMVEAQIEFGDLVEINRTFINEREGEDGEVGEWDPLLVGLQAYIKNGRGVADVEYPGGGMMGDYILEYTPESAELLATAMKRLRKPRLHKMTQKDILWAEWEDVALQGTSEFDRRHFTIIKKADAETKALLHEIIEKREQKCDELYARYDAYQEEKTD